MRTYYFSTFLLAITLATACKKDPLVADFQTTDSLFAGDTVSFVNLSQNATSYLWDFGDGTGSAETNPTHIYSQRGTFKVRLTAQNDDGVHIVEKNLLINGYVDKLAGNYLVNGVRTDWGGYVSNEYYPVGVCMLNVSVVNDSTLKVLGWEVLRRPDNIGNMDCFSFADEYNYIHMGSHSGAYFTYYQSTDSVYCLIKHEHLGGGTRWYYKGKKE